MKETPIIMSGPMVKAILKGRKSQTRRVMKNPDALPLAIFESSQYAEAYCPYGGVGDRLWVRETWADIPETTPGNLHYRASATQGNLDWFKQEGWKWKPSIFMPKRYARLWLELTKVRVERLQEISEEDAQAEGMGNMKGLSSFVTSFKWYWDSLNAAPKPQYHKEVISYYVSYPWEDIRGIREHRGKPWYVRGNPWNWCLSFKKVAL